MRTYISAPRSDEEIEALEKRVEDLETKLREAQTALTALRDREPPWQRSADNLADEVAALVARHVLDERSGAADALLDYRNPPRTPRSDRLAELESRLREAEAIITESIEAQVPGAIKQAFALGEKPRGVPDCNGGTPECRVISEDQCPGHATWCPKWRKVMRPNALKDAPATRPTDTELATMSWFDLRREAERARAAELKLTVGLDQARTAYRLEAESVVQFGAQLEVERAQRAELEAKLREDR